MNKPIENYKDILEVRPKINCNTGEPSDPCCDSVCCVACSPIILSIWALCCIKITFNKSTNCCKTTEVPSPKVPSPDNSH